MGHGHGNTYFRNSTGYVEGHLGGVCRETFNEALLLGQHRLLALVGGLALVRAQTALGNEGLVVTGVLDQRTTVDIDNSIDDPVHEVFGLKSHRFQSLYHFTVGGPQEDSRLMTRPAYFHLQGSRDI